MRFSLDDRVTWDESLNADGSRLVHGTVDAFLEDECMVRIRIDGGGTTLAPTFSSRLKHARVSIPSEANDTIVESSPLIRRAPSMALEVDYFGEHDGETVVPGMTKAELGLSRAELKRIRKQVEGIGVNDTIPAPRRK
jgi:hypothetical protein